MRLIVIDQVTASVGPSVWSVCLSDTVVSNAKTAEPIAMPFWMLSRVDTMNHVLDGGPDRKHVLYGGTLAQPGE